MLPLSAAVSKGGGGGRAECCSEPRRVTCHPCPRQYPISSRSSSGDPRNRTRRPKYHANHIQTDTSACLSVRMDIWTYTRACIRCSSNFHITVCDMLINVEHLRRVVVGPEFCVLQGSMAQRRCHLQLWPAPEETFDMSSPCNFLHSAI